MTKECPHCGAKYFKEEHNARGKYTKCCMEGKIALPPIQPPPPDVLGLFEGITDDSRHFLANLRQYNSMMAFASWQAQLRTHAGRGVPVITIHGKAYHMTGVQEPNENRTAQYAELYIMDTRQAMRQRVDNNQNLKENIIQLLQNELMAVNPFGQHYQAMGDILEEQRRLAVENNEPIPTFKMVVTGRPNQDRRYDNPTAREIAAIYTAHDGGAPNPADREFQARTKDGTYMKLYATEPTADPMTYPLLFFYGERGYNVDIRRQVMQDGRQDQHRNRRTRVSLNEFYAYRIQVRNAFSALHSASMLFQQYLVDAYTKIEGNTLNWILRNQQQLRVDSYQGLMDHLNRRANTEMQMANALNPNQPVEIQVGRVVILPSSFTGSQRNMYQNFQDAMTIVRKYGRPDIFLTMTANPKWPEILANILPHQSPNDRPDIVTRVFQLKLHLHEVLDNNLLGKVIAHVYVVEFQKRGLPHAHMLLFLSQEDKPRTAEQIDNLISAEIPNKQEHPRYRKLVKTHMMHAPCGHLNPRTVCMEDNKCKKNFPKKIVQQTEPNVDGYPLYRRRGQHNSVKKGQRRLNDTWVVPHNRHLLLRFESHINVEVCSSIKSVKYIFKYIHKGQDMAHVEIIGENQPQQAQHVQHNKVHQYINARYLGPHEAVHRMLKFSMHEKSHAIQRLQTHLPLQNSVYFQAGNERSLQNINPNTSLTAWFTLNQQDPAARDYLYHEIPEYYTYNQRTRAWHKRQKRTKPIIGRIYQAFPRQEENYALRLLLLNRRGATSFEDIRTVNNQLHDTFKRAALAMGLLEDDAEHRRCMAEAALFNMPSQLRELFATLLMFQPPSDLRALFNEFVDVMSEDFVRLEQLTDPTVTFADRHMYQCLLDIDNALHVHGHSMNNYPDLPDLPTNFFIPTPDADQIDIFTEQQQGLEMLTNLNPEQLEIHTKVIEAVQNQSEQNCYFVDGPAGTGKTFLYNTLVHSLQSMGHKVQCMAWSGIAATLLINGRTSHSTFQIPIPLLPNSTCNIKIQSARAQMLRNTTLFIWDEASMIPGNALRAMDTLLRDITQVKRPFGGKFMLLGGDFRQVLPVISRAGREKIVAESLKSMQIRDLWGIFEQHRLHRNMRAIQDATYQEFSEWLLRIGNHTEPHDENEIITLPDRICVNSSQQMIDSIYPHPTSGEPNLMLNPLAMSERCCLTPKNENSHEINKLILQRLQTPTHTYFSADKVLTDDPEEAHSYPMEFLNAQTPSGMPLRKLELKVGAIVILLRNLNPKKGLCNGTRLIVRHLKQHVLTADIITSAHRGQQVMIPKITMSCSESSLPFTLSRKQFPIRLAYCLTINKAQGQSLKYVGIYLPQPVFSHGQLYVAMSRAKSFDGIKVFIPDSKKTKNVVYPEVL
eukprot:gene17148-biopygen14755